jgi:hypothetical protein
MTTPAEKLGALHQDNAPEVNEDAMSAEADAQAQVEETASKYPGLADKQGRTFDASIHEANHDGTPAVSARNSRILKIKKGVRRGASKPGGSGPQATATGSHIGSVPGPGATPGVSQGSRAAAVSAVGGIQALGIMVMGKEWKYARDERTGTDEELGGIEAFTKYFEARGVVDIPPGVAVAIWSMAYAIPRFTQPQTQTRAQLAYAWLRHKWSSIRGARSHNRDDTIRQDDAGNGPEPKVQG